MTTHVGAGRFDASKMAFSGMSVTMNMSSEPCRRRFDVIVKRDMIRSMTMHVLLNTARYKATPMHRV